MYIFLMLIPPMYTLLTPVVTDIAGVIITIGELNHEVSPVLSLSVTVAQGPYASQSTLRVSVIDINEPHTLNPLSDVRLDAVTTRVGTIVSI